jgi:hypothetical protein
MILDEIIEEHFIRKTEMDNAMMDLCETLDDDKDNDNDDDEITIFYIENSKKAHYIASTARPASCGNKDLKPQMKDKKKKMPENDGTQAVP